MNIETQPFFIEKTLESSGKFATFDESPAVGINNKPEKKMTYEDVMKKMDGKKFYSENFGGEIVTVNGVEVVGESGLLNIIGSKRDVRDLFEDFKASR